jgi:putative transposase
VHLRYLKHYTQRYNFRLQGYCLMTNRVHIIRGPEDFDSLANTIGRTHSGYSQYSNQFHGCSGQVWQGRFCSRAVYETHYGNPMYYVEQNPARERMVRKARRCPWSSVEVHVGEVQDNGLSDLAPWRNYFGKGARWRCLFEQGMEDGFAEKCRLQTHTGRPPGSDGFLSKLEHALCRRVRA